MPALMLKKMVMGNFEKGLIDSDIADSVDFMVDKVSTTYFSNTGKNNLVHIFSIIINCPHSFIVWF